MSIKNSTAVDRFESNQPNESIAKTTFADWCVLNEVNPAEVSELVDSNDKAAFYDTAFRLGTRNFLNSFIAQTSRQMPDLNALSSELKNMRMYGDSEEVGVQERETAQLFQRIISSYVYNKATSHPKDILDTQQMNCVGASHIGGALLEAVGIRVLQASGGSHCFLIMVTSDNRVWWQDMQDGKEIPELFNQELTDEKITGSLDGVSLSARAIADFARSPKVSITFSVNFQRWKDDPITLRPFLAGMEEQELINTGFMFTNKGKHSEAVEVFEIVRQKVPSDPSIYLGLAKGLRGLGRYSEAVDNCKKALELDPSYTYVQGEMDEIIKEMKAS